MFIDETLERRKGPKIKNKGYDRDAVRSSKNILVGDGGFACAELACLITKLKMNARLYDFPALDEPGKRGRMKTKGAKLFSFRDMMAMPDLGWQEIVVEGYGKKKKKLDEISVEEAISY